MGCPGCKLIVGDIVTVGSSFGRGCQIPVSPETIAAAEAADEAFHPGCYDGCISGPYSNTLAEAPRLCWKWKQGDRPIAPGNPPSPTPIKPFDPDDF